MKIVLASSNAHKVKEINEIVAGSGLEFILPPDGFDPIEDGKTFEENSLIKAKAALSNGNHTIEGSLSMPGNPYLIAGLNVEIKDVGYFSGKYHITEAHHTIDKQMGYATNVEVKSC